MPSDNVKFVLVASDVHSDEEAFEKLIKVANSRNCIAFLYAGDLDTDNWFISNALKNRNFLFIPVLGNCDNRYSYIDLNLTTGLFQTCSFFGKKIFISHGHVFSEPFMAGLEENFDIVINGHTHVPNLKKEEKTIFLNPGSASSPRGYSKAGYATITEKEIKLISFEDNKTIAEIDISG